MSAAMEVPSKSKKRSYFCKICRVACLNLESHNRREGHKKLKETSYGPKFRRNLYTCLQDYITCPRRREPFIGLQYIIQLYPQTDHPDAFKCTLCKRIGPLFFIVKHLRTLKHRVSYLSKSYSELFPLYKKYVSHYEKNAIVREHALQVEHREKSLDIKVLKGCSSRVGVKNDFWKYNTKRQESSEHKKKEAQKENILKYMETFVIASPEEAVLVQNFAEELETAADVFCLNTRTKRGSEYKSERYRTVEHKERKYSRHSDYKSSKKRSEGHGKQSVQSPSTSSCNDAVMSPSDKRSAKETGTRKRARRDSTDKLSTFSFSAGSESKLKTSGLLQEQHVPSATSSVKEQAELSSDNVNETTEAIGLPKQSSWGDSQESSSKRFKKNSTEIARWESLLSSHRPDETHSKFSWGTKVPSSDNSEISTADGEKTKNRRVSLDVLSTFTLFSQEGREYGSGNSQLSATSPFLSFRNPFFKAETSENVCEDKGNHHDDTNDVEDKEQESSCSPSSNVVNVNITITETSNDILMPPDQEHHDGKCSPVHSASGKTSPVQDFDTSTKSHQNSDSEMNHDQLSNMNTDVAHTGGSDQDLDAHSVENVNLETCTSGHSDTNTDTQDSPSSVSGSTLPSSSSHMSGRHLSPEVLQLFKGKDTESIINILKTLSPFYPALQEINLEVFAKGLSETGEIH